MELKEAESALQLAVDIDLKRSRESFDPKAALIAVGVMQLHKVYYDSGLAQNPEMVEILALNGATRKLIEALKEARLWEYTAETLNRMYGLD